MGWLSPKSLVDDDEFEWLLATIKWIRAEESRIGADHGFDLALPKSDIFSIQGLQGHTLAVACFDAIRAHCDMEDWQCNLRLGAADKPELQALGFVRSRKGVLGTLSAPSGSNIPTIHYNPKLLQDVGQLIATLAHELSHHRMHAFRSNPPGGPALEELATDVLAILLGFGIFLGNSAKNFSAYTSFDVQGWSSQRSGYLSEKAILTVLAVSERLAGRDATDTAGPYLKGYLQSDLKKADRHIRAFADLPATIEAIDLDDFG